MMCDNYKEGECLVCDTNYIMDYVTKKCVLSEEISNPDGNSVEEVKEGV